TRHLAEMRDSYQVRTALGLDQGFYQRTWESAVAMFGRPLLFAGGLWLLLLAFRLVSGRGRARDLVCRSFAFAFLSYIHVIRAGALIHVYRYLYGGVACAIAASDLAEAAGRLPRSAPRLGGAVALLLLAATLPSSWKALIESRRHG